MASSYLSRTFSGTYNSGTISMWVKRTNLGSAYIFYNESSSDSNDYGLIQFDSNDRIEFMTVTNGSHTQKLITARKFYDTSAWYHFVFAMDTDNSTADNRLRIYVNGVEETTFDTRDNGSQGDTNYFFQTSATNKHRLFASAGGSANLDALVTHIHIVPNAQLAPTVFGEFETASGVWKAKTSPSVTYTAQGVFLKFENSGNMGLDSSGNTNNMTASGTISQNVDTPANNFSVLNTLETPYPGQSPTYSNGATTGAGTETGFLAGASTFGLSSGKWYAEFKVTAGTNSLQVMGAVISPVGNMGTQAPHDNANFYGVRGNGTKYEPGGSGTNSWTSTWTTNDIISLALDCDNNRLYIAKNGQYADGSGNYDEAFTGSPAYVTLASDKTYHLMGASISTGSGVSLTMQSNFGSGFFGTTAVASANADANGFGAFEYAVPSGYYAICTKNIKEFG